MTRNRKKAPPGVKEPITFETVREIAGRLPGAVEGTSYGTPAFHVAKKLFVRLHQNAECLVVKIDFDHRAMRMKTDPETFYITDHYLNYPWILVRLSSVALDDLKDLLHEAWRQSAPPRLLADPDSTPKGTIAGGSRKRRKN
jgi:hypothetical protein